MFIRSRHLGLISSIFILGLTAAARAQYAVNTFYPGQTTANPNHGAPGIGEVNSGIDLATAVQFTSAATGVVSNVTLALDGFTAVASDNVALMTDSGGQFGSVLGSWNTGPLPPPPYASAPLTVINNTDPGVVLTTGQNYWIVLSAESLGRDGASQWCGGAFSSYYNEALSFNGGASWNYYWENGYEPAFSVSVSPAATPEPSSSAVLGLGLLPLFRRKRRSA